jgi:crotonobetainyl-CoA:carnitine CoA-transferase CaiB-like acyl-CoA transferase
MSTENVSALGGIKVLELCSFVAGPFCAKLLADMGAEVVKIEPPDVGDEARRRGPFYRGEPGMDSSLLFMYLNTNKQGITLDVSAPTGKDMLLELLKKADLIIEDMPSDRIETLGLDYESLHRANPQLVVTSITPFGRTGPYKDYKSYYLNTYHAGGDGYLLPGGRLADQLYPEGEPIKAGGYLGEYQAGLSAAVATIATLLGRTLDGQGRHIDMSKQEALINLNSADFCLYPNRDYQETRRNRHLAHYTGGLYRCKDGFWEFLVPSQRHWEAMVKVMGEPAWTLEERFATQESRYAHRAEIDELIEEWALGHTREEIYHSLQGQGVACGPVYSTEEVLQDPQMEYRGFFVDMEFPHRDDLGNEARGNLKTPSAAYKLSHTPFSRIRRPAPSLGQHNAEIYGDWLGYGGRELSELRRRGVI